MASVPQLHHKWSSNGGPQPATEVEPEGDLTEVEVEPGHWVAAAN